MRAAEVDRAVSVLRAGGLVAFATETVYGLGADATNAVAVAKVFAAKGRPTTNPLIVHVADVDTARRYAAAWPEAAARLGERFWPGPLTLVLPRGGEIVPGVSAGRETVGLRVPGHPLALQLLQDFGGAVAAPSANRSNRISPTTAQHVREEFGDAVDVILDGGPCAVGIESTVLDLTAARPTILRPGGVSRGRIEAVVGPVDVAAGSAGPSAAAQSPGRQPVHYAPRTPAYRFPHRGLSMTLERGRDLPGGRRVYLTLTADDGRRPGLTFMALPGDPAAYARRLYAALREADSLDADVIFVEMPPDAPEWEAVRDRITRATRAG